MASVGDIIAIIDLVFKVGKYADNVRAAPDEIKQFKEQINILLSTLRGLEKQLNLSNTEAKENAQRIFQHLVPYMENLENQLERNSKSSRKWIYPLGWPSRKDRLIEAFDRVHQFVVQLQALQQGESINIVNALQASDYEARVSSVFGKLTPRIARALQDTPTRAKNLTTGTGKWFFDEEQVSQWRSSANGLLWVNGFQGSGKTGLMTTFGDRLVADAGDPPAFHVARVYCDHKVLENLVDPLDIIMSLWIQLVKFTKFTLDLEALEALETALAPGGFRTDEAEVRLKMEVFNRTISHGGNTVLILDGLDEVPEMIQDDLVGYLKSLHQQNHHCRLIVTSRPYSRIRDMFDNDPQYSLQAAEIDIRLYIRDRISKKGQRSLFKRPGTTEWIVDNLTERCKGSFLMAKLFMDDVLRAATEDQCREILQDLPVTAQEAYDRGLERLAQTYPRPLPKQTLPCLAIQALFWVAFAPAPMMDRQLKQALAVYEKDTDYNKEKETDLGIDALSGELLIVDPESSIVREAHKSFTDHLTIDEARNRWFPGIREHIHTILMRYLCLECMKKPAFGHFSGARFRRSYPLAEYAVKYWGEGLKDILQPNTPLWEATREFLQTPFGMWNRYIVRRAAEAMSRFYWGWDLELPSTGSLSGLHWIVHFELGSLISAIVNYEKQVPVEDPIPITPLGLTAVQDSVYMAKKLIKGGVNVNVGVGHVYQPLHTAIRYGCKDIVSLLLEKGADMTLRQIIDDQSPLDAAYDVDKGEFARMLAKSIPGKGSLTGQELQFLVKGAFVTDLKRVLDDGFDVNHPCENGKLALDYAYELGHSEIIDILTARGATTKLTWPAFTAEPHQYPQNLPLNWGNGPAITKQKLWDRDSPAHVHSKDIIAGGGVESETESEEDNEGSDSTALLLEVQVDERVKLPLQSIVFESVSNDQGWSRHKSQGTYLGSTRSWIDVCVMHQDKRSQFFRIQGNVHASDQPRMHTNIWSIGELESSSPGKAQFMKSIQHGSTLQVYARAKGSNWQNSVSFVRVQLYGSEGSKEAK